MPFAGAEVLVREHACVRAEHFGIIFSFAERNFDFSAHRFDNIYILYIYIYIYTYSDSHFEIFIECSRKKFEFCNIIIANGFADIGSWLTFRFQNSTNMLQ